jgi:AmmeMemoRadiSam system protein A
MLPHFDSLSEEDRRILLSRARQAILETICRSRFPDLPSVSGRLAQPGGAFVTLRCAGKLRGCIGRAEAAQELAETVLQCAITAASQDPRFKPLCPEELAPLEIEISVLSEPHPVRPEEIELGIHGIIVVCGANRGLLLPQVAIERNWSATQFLEAVCRKARLRPDAWRDPETKLFAFTAEVFSDAGLVAQEETRGS